MNDALMLTRWHFSRGERPTKSNASPIDVLQKQGIRCLVLANRFRGYSGRRYA